MVVNEHWLPFEDINELRLLEKLSHLKRKSVKGLRFNLPRDAPIVSVTLPEQNPRRWPCSSCRRVRMTTTSARL